MYILYCVVRGQGLYLHWHVYIFCISIHVWTRNVKLEVEKALELQKSGHFLFYLH